MDINKAVDILNRERWRERDDWRVRTDYDHLKNAIASYAYSKPGNERPIALENIDALAIAELLELRQAVEPLIKVAQLVSADEREHQHLIPSINTVWWPSTAAWRRLAEYGKE